MKELVGTEKAVCLIINYSCFVAFPLASPSEFLPDSLLHSSKLSCSAVPLFCDVENEFQSTSGGIRYSPSSYLSTAADLPQSFCSYSVA